jgi:membrane fusion protein, multidrug efflux system
MKTTQLILTHLVIATLVTLAASCGGGDATQAEETNQHDSAAVATPDSKTKTVEITSLVPQPFNTYIEVQGVVDAEENVSINAEMPGTVAKVNVQLGDAVAAGQVVAELDSKAMQQGMAELQSGLDLATTLFEKQKNLWQQNIGTEVQYLAAKNQKESLEKKMATLHEQLKMTKIISPISGTIDAVDIKIGQATAPGIPAIRVVNMNSLKVKGEVSESYISKVKVGNNALIILPDLKDTIQAKISYSAKVISPLNRTFTVTIRLPGKNNYYPNQIALIKIMDYSNPKAFVVPVSAVQRTENENFVFISENNQAKKVKVTAGKTYNGRIEIVTGLKAGDHFIAKGFQDLNEGEALSNE